MGKRTEAQHKGQKLYWFTYCRRKGQQFNSLDGSKCVGVRQKHACNHW